jgi:hypothetical protein
MCLDFLPDGQVTGRGGDFGGKFLITCVISRGRQLVCAIISSLYPSGAYRGTFVDLRKQYDDEDEDVYLATGHMIPWGIYGRWTVPDKPTETLGYWCIWHYEVSDLRPLAFAKPNE